MGLLDYEAYTSAAAPPQYPQCQMQCVLVQCQGLPWMPVQGLETKGAPSPIMCAVPAGGMTCAVPAEATALAPSPIMCPGAVIQAPLPDVPAFPMLPANLSPEVVCSGPMPQADAASGGLYLGPSQGLLEVLSSGTQPSTGAASPNVTKFKNPKEAVNETQKQVEWYLSDANLRKDQFFREQIQVTEGGWLSMDLVQKCNRMKPLEKTNEEVKAACASSTTVEFKEDASAVRRSGNKPLPPVTPAQKELWKCQKKLREIRKIEETKSRGGKVDKLQLEKLEKLPQAQKAVEEAQRVVQKEDESEDLRQTSARSSSQESRSAFEPQSQPQPQWQPQDTVGYQVFQAMQAESVHQTQWAPPSPVNYHDQMPHSQWAAFGYGNEYSMAPASLPFPGSAAGWQTTHARADGRWEGRVQQQQPHEHVVGCKHKSRKRGHRQQQQVAPQGHKKDSTGSHTCVTCGGPCVYYADLVQKMETGSDAEVQAAVNELRGQVYSASIHEKGCRAVQKALQVAVNPVPVELLQELHGRVLELAKHSHGNYVLGKAIEVLAPCHCRFILTELTGMVRDVAKHRFGCRIINRLIQHSGAGSPALGQILTELQTGVIEICKHPFAHYPLSTFLEHGNPEHKRDIARALRGNIWRLANHKTANHVIEDAMMVQCEVQCELFEVQCELFEEISLTASLDKLEELATKRYGGYVARSMAKFFRTNQAELHRLGIRSLSVWNQLAQSPTLAETKGGQRLLEEIWGTVKSTQDKEEPDSDSDQE